MVYINCHQHNIDIKNKLSNRQIDCMLQEKYVTQSLGV